MKRRLLFSAAAAFFLLGCSVFCEETALSLKKSEANNSLKKNIKTEKPPENFQSDSTEQPVLIYPCEEKCCIKKYPDDYQVLQSAKGCRERGCGPYVDLSALIWQSKEGNLEYASKFLIMNNYPDNLAQKVYIVIPDFGWRPGLKADVGYIFENDNWDIKTLWTFYRGEFTHVKKHPTVDTYPTDNGVLPLQFISTFKGEVTPSPRYRNAAGDWDMYFNSLDFELAKNFFVRRKLSTRLLFGLKGAWIKQFYKIEYAEGNTVVGPLDNITLLDNHVNFKNNLWGVGPRIGFESKCHLIWGFKLLANGSASALISHFVVKRKQHDWRINNLTSSFEVIPFRLKDDFYTIKPNIQVVLGFEWSRCFRQSFFAATMGYEMQYFWGINQMKRTFDKNNAALFYSNRGDLQMHGLIVSLKYEF